MSVGDSTELDSAPGVRVPVHVSGLRIELVGGSDVVDDISFDVTAGHVLGVVGESGSGKTTVASALLAHARRGARIVAGRIVIGGLDILAAAPEAVQSHRGRVVSFVPQDPGTALNPSLRIRSQLDELFAVHTPDVTVPERRQRIAQVLADVMLPTDDEFLDRYPHQLSGGQQQRVCIAMAFVLDPAVIVFDEPTTGLDVTTQAAILGIIRRLCSDSGVAAVYISHDLAVVSELADRVAVMYAGRVVEVGPTPDLLSSPNHPYTALLAAAIPDVRYRKELRSIPGQAPTPAERPTGCPFAVRCPLVTDRCATEAPQLTAVGRVRQVACHRSGEVTAVAGRVGGHSPRSSASTPVLAITGVQAGYHGRTVLDGVSATLQRGECLAVVGESGSGKTTLARTVAGLVAPTAGTIALDGAPLAAMARRRSPEQRRAIQYVFQNPYASFNPRATIGSSLMTVLRHFGERDRAAAQRRAEEALEATSLPRHFLSAYPDQLSGGERQRAAVARALVGEPEILICDEITSALDVSVQAAIVGLLRKIQLDRGLSMLFVTHDLALVRSVADRMVVLNSGRIVETGDVEATFEQPQHEYTQQLLMRTPRVASSSPPLPGAQG